MELPVQHELRAFEVFDHLPSGCILVPMCDGRHAPHLREGEWAVVDPADTAFVPGELFHIDWSGGRRSIMQAVVRRETDAGRDYDGIWFVPLNRPRSLPDGSLDWSGPCYTAEGPLAPEYLPDYLRGRVLGIYQAPASSDRLPTIN